MRIKHRSPVAIIIFTIITFGLYPVYWAFQTKEEINSLGASIPTAWLLAVPIANFYFLYRYSEGFSVYVKKDNSTILWFLLYVFVYPVAMVLFQIELNRYATPSRNPIPQTSH